MEQKPRHQQYLISQSGNLVSIESPSKLDFEEKLKRKVEVDGFSIASEEDVRQVLERNRLVDERLDAERRAREERSELAARILGAE